MMLLVSLPTHRAFALVFGCLLSLAIPQTLCAQETSNVAAKQVNDVVVTVNGTAITADDLAHRQRFLAITSGLGKKMKAVIKSKETQKAYREFVTKRNPTSKKETQNLQTEFIKQLKEKIIGETSASMRDQALEQLISEKIMLQAANDMKITVSDKDIDERLTKMAQSGPQKLTLQVFLQQFSEQQINVNTMRDRIRAQIAWRLLIRQVYGARIAYDTSDTADKRIDKLQEQFQIFSDQHLKDLKDKSRLKMVGREPMGGALPWLEHTDQLNPQ
jgi:hypothetical protein